MFTAVCDGFDYIDTGYRDAFLKYPVGSTPEGFLGNQMSGNVEHHECCGFGCRGQ